MKNMNIIGLPGIAPPKAGRKDATASEEWTDGGDRSQRQGSLRALMPKMIDASASKARAR